MKIYLIFYVFLFKAYKTLNIVESRQMPQLLIKVENNQEFEVEKVLNSLQYQNRLKYLIYW